MSEDKSLNNEEEQFDIAVRRETGTLTLPEIAPEHLPTLKDVYGRGKLAELKSFGGKSLADNMERVDKAIAETRELGSIYNRNHSAWTRAYINLDSYDPWFNMRQVAAEVASRRNALTEAKWRHLENETKVKKLMVFLRMFDQHFAKLDAQGDGDVLEYDPQEPIFLDYDDEGNKIVINPNREIAELDKYKLETELAKLQEGLLSGMNHIEGAMKEILILDDLYTQLQEQINEFNEEDYEKHNARAHLRQAIAQSLRDVRGGGSISKGEQRFLEQIGVNPTRMQSILREFVKEVESLDNISVVDIHKFICETADAVLASGAVEKKAELFGVKPNQDSSFMFLDRIGTRKQLTGPVDEGDVEGFPFGGMDD